MLRHFHRELSKHFRTEEHMSKNRKPRKPYQPRALDPRQAMGLIEAARQRELLQRPLAADQIQSLGLAYHVAFEALLSGDGGANQWDALAQAVNMASVLGAHVIGGEYDATFAAARTALLHVREQAEATTCWVLDADAIAVLGETLTIHDEQLKVVSRNELRAAVAECQRLRTAAAGYKEAA